MFWLYKCVRPSVGEGASRDLAHFQGPPRNTHLFHMPADSLSPFSSYPCGKMVGCRVNRRLCLDSIP